jgi:sugar phosphate permease
MVSLPLVMDSMPGVDRAEFGGILSMSYLLYAFGKLLSGPLIDWYGGKIIFMSGIALSLLANTWFVMVPTGSTAPFTLKTQLLLLGTFWSMNRLVQVCAIVV